jgi:hypothetical protein
VFLLSSKLSFSFQFKNARLLLVLTAILAPSGFCLNAVGQPKVKREVAFPTPIQWNKQKRVNRYRLQVAGDEKFQNVFFDGLIVGERYVANGLSPGYYYWRVAPADVPSGDFSKATRFFVSGGVVTSGRRTNRAVVGRSSHAPRPKVR